MSGGAERDGVETGAYEVRNLAGGSLVEHERQGAWPESISELTSRVTDSGVDLRLFESQDMDDQRIEARPLLGGEDLGHRARVESTGAEPVNRLGREGDNLAPSE